MWPLWIEPCTSVFHSQVSNFYLFDPFFLSVDKMALCPVQRLTFYPVFSCKRGHPICQQCADMQEAKVLFQQLSSVPVKLPKFHLQQLSHCQHHGHHHHHHYNDQFAQTCPTEECGEALAGVDAALEKIAAVVFGFQLMKMIVIKVVVILLGDNQDAW